jgi:methionine synthase I (cobalamin-dependent)
MFSGNIAVQDELQYHPDTPYLKEYLENNIKIFGGCCGTTPEIISAIKEKIGSII